MILDGIAKAGNHDGGALAFGPDGMLYAGVGDAGEPAQRPGPRRLNGKILRMDPLGNPPIEDPNPDPDSLVWSMGHRNVQGLAWDSRGRLWATEFGQDTFDEVNLIEPGGNYGWPEVEGMGDDDRFINPQVTWSTDEASPSGARDRSATRCTSARCAASDCGDPARPATRPASREAAARGTVRPAAQRRSPARRVAVDHHQQPRRPGGPRR